VALRVASGDRLEVGPRCWSDLGVVEEVPILPDNLEAVVVARVERAATVKYYALEYILAVGGGHPTRRLHIPVEANGRVEEDALRFLTNLAGPGMILALSQADGLCGGGEGATRGRRLCF
jgi:hypothetical protein